MDDVNLPLIAGLIAIIVLVPTVAMVLWRQFQHWKRAENARDAALRNRDTFAAALDTAPEGYIAWFHKRGSTEAEEQCSRRLAVLLDLLRGRDANFADVLEGFDAVSQDMLRESVARLKETGNGFRLGLVHTASNRRIDARGLRAVGEDGETLADVVWMSDITESAAAVEALTEETSSLKREAALMKVALDSIDVPVWVRDDDLSLIYCNMAYVLAVDGRNAADVVARGREIAPRVTVREARALAAAARAAGEIRKSPFHMVLDGSRRLMEVTEAPMRSKQERAKDGRTNDATAEPMSGKAQAPLLSDGTGRLTAGMAYDVTRQEELETRLKREAAAQADVLERLGTAIAVFGPDTRLAFHNAAFAKLWTLDAAWLNEAPGYGAVLDAMRSQRRLPEVADFPAFKDKELARFNSLLEPLEDVLHLPDGGTLRRTTSPHPMGGLLMTYEDVTDKLALERSYNTLIAVQRETIDNLQEAVAVFGADGRLRLANPAFAEMWELNAAALAESPALTNVVDAFKDLFDDETVFARHRATLLAALDADQQRTTQQGRVVRSKGSVMEFVAVPLPDGGVLFCYNDVSAPERAVQNLRARAESVATSERLKSDIAARVFTALSNDLSRLSTLAAAKGKEQGLGGLARSLSDTVADAEDLTGFNPSSHSIRLDAVDVAELVGRVTRLLTPNAKLRGLDLSTAGTTDAGWIVADGSRLKLALFLLLGAAIDCARGKVGLTVERRGKTIAFIIAFQGESLRDVVAARIATEFCRKMAGPHDDKLIENIAGDQTTLTWTLPVGDIKA
ncbi:MAG: PAS-domain containing protein [Rhodospirillaceae bacterium]|nr:PAS-domain containing protein [Rhodospirillaceae bacterium]